MYPETNNDDAKFLVTASFANNYVSIVTGRLSSLDETTVYGLLVGELVLQMIACYQIIQLNARVEGTSEASEKATVISDRTKKRKH